MKAERKGQPPSSQPLHLADMRSRAVRVAFLISIVSLIPVFVGCNASESSVIPVTGRIEDMEIVANSLRSLKLRDNSGDIHTYRVAKNHQLNVSIEHLREHQTLGVPVTLFLEKDGGAFVVSQIAD
jgi:hypothetical protein